jgi:hypothetical protein
MGWALANVAQHVHSGLVVDVTKGGAVVSITAAGAVTVAASVGLFRVTGDRIRKVRKKKMPDEGTNDEPGFKYQG